MREAQKYRSWVEVDLDNFTRNWDEMKRLVGPGVRILQVVKADAYGHGAMEISNVALKNGADCLGVANADEGAQLRVSGISAPILILSPATIGEIGQILKYNLTPSVSDIGFARELQRRGRKTACRIPIHIEVDTGMGRVGTLYADAFDMIREVMELPNLTVEGIYTHLAVSEIRGDYNLQQHALFAKLLERLEDRHIRIPLRHMSNSGAVLNYPEFHFDMVRPGIMSYGIYPSAETSSLASLAPVMAFKTTIVLIKDFPGGASIGYGRTFTTERPTKIATIPVGYGDGYGWVLSNRGEALVRGCRAPIVGRISMDMCALDVGHIPDCEVGDEVVLMGRQGKEYISANEIAEKVGTISYEILCALGKRAPRVFLHKGKTGTVEPRLRRIFIADEEKSIARIDNIIRNCFQARARNEELGDAIYYEMFETLFGKEDRQLELRTNFRYDINVRPAAEEARTPGDKEPDYFHVSTHIEYVKTLRNPVFLIGCATNNEQLEAFFDDKRCEYRWILNRGEDLVVERDFQVARVRIDREDVPVLRTENTKRGYEVWCGGDDLRRKLNRPVKVEIEIRTKKAKSNRNFSVYLVYPTRGLDILFDYRGMNFRNVKEVSFFAGRHPYPQVIREKGKSVRIKISDEEWIFPNSGVSFIWDV